MAKKRSSGVADQAAIRPSKKRKSAEASKAKLKEIAEAEEIDDAELFPEVKERATVEAQQERMIIEAQDDEVEEVERVVAPGFRLWNTTSMITAGGELSEASVFDTASQKHSLVLGIQNEEAFTVKPLVITQGPYKGYRVFMLDSGAKFRFFDFPAEIRNLVYSFLVEEDQPIKMSTAKIVSETRRPVRSTFLDYESHKDFKRERGPGGRWIDQPPSSATVLRASKRCFNEAAPLLYGNNRFQFLDHRDLKIFLDRIGSMRKYLCRIDLTHQSYHFAKSHSVYKVLQDATDLRSLTLHVGCVAEQDDDFYSRYAVSTDLLSRQTERLMKSILNAHRHDDNEFDILNVIGFTWDRCYRCKPLAPGFSDDCVGNTRRGRLLYKCKDADEYCEKVLSKYKKNLASLLKIEQ